MRLPSMKQLESNSGNAWGLLDLFARECRDEIHGLKSGHVVTTNGGTTTKALKNARRRLARAYAVADRVGVYVGQPSRTRVRVPALSRPHLE